MRRVFASFLLLFLASRSAEAAKKDKHLNNVKEIFSWMNDAENGFVSEKQSVRRMVEGDMDTPLIVYATQDIAEGELLVQVPFSHILQSDDKMGDAQRGWYCGTTNTLATEMMKGADSFYAPYVQYINDEPDNQLPAQYSNKAKLMLLEITGKDPDQVNRSPVFNRDEAPDERLMPEGIVDSLNNWINNCGGKRSDKIAAKAASMVVQRADDSILIPAYDAYNHRNNDFINGKEYMNARTKTTLGKYHQTFAIRDIKKGEQIFISYNMCDQCEGRMGYGFGTAEMFRDYGFVEWYPQRWWYPGFGDYHYEENPDEVAQFDLFQNEDTKDLTVVWTHLSKEKERMDRFKIFLANEIRRLKRLKNIDWAKLYIDDKWKETEITPYEWSNINQLLDANVVAMTLALADLTTSGQKPFTVSPDSLAELLADTSHYDSLETAEADDLAKYRLTCDNDEFFNFMGFIDTEEAFFSDRGQLLGYFESFFFNRDDEDVNVCFDINNTVQMCSSYRPHHHEYMTHAAARYVESVKRVAIIGNGNSMMLHEVLKYPDIEQVVILELDQTVTRKSFKHFKVDPHFHDPRVDWWFGDVAKSLLVLPESYWQSFDLVLVDLPEIVLKNEVTKDLDVLAAVSKLMNPDTGVIVENELRLSTFAEEFDHAMEFYYPVPALCSEVLAFGSYAVDFFRAPIYDHGIADMGNLLYINSPEGPEERHDMVHDYRTKACSSSDDEKTATVDANDIEQTSSHGVLELVTLEQLSSFPKSLESVATTLNNSIEGLEGFTITENGVHFDDEQQIAWIVLEEGYIVARIQDNSNTDGDDKLASYLGFDIQLWSQIHRLSELKDAIASAYESKHVSSHKIVVGGMFGKGEVKHIGPVSATSSTSDCASASTTESSKFDAEAAGKMITEEIVSLTNSREVVAAVFCGSKGDPCTTLDTLKFHKQIKDVIPIYDCASGGTAEELYECEHSILGRFKAEIGVRKKKRLHMLAFDSGASQELHQIANSIFDSQKNRLYFLRYHSVVTTFPSKLEEEPWRREFLDRFRKQIHHDPVKLGEFEIDDNYWFGVVSTNDKEVVTKFDLLEEKLQERLSTSVQLRNMHGGLYQYTGDAPYEGPEFREKHYDKTIAEEHFQEQIPLAIQTIIQYEGNDDMKEQAALGNSMDCNFVEKLVYGSAMSEGLLPDDQKTLFRYPVGDGCIVMMLGDSFNIVSVWDGKVHLDVNFFAASGGEESTASAAVFDKKLRGFAPFVDIATDSQPRGLGRVVNFAGDLVTLDRLEIGRQLMSQGSYEDEEEEEEDDDEYGAYGS